MQSFLGLFGSSCQSEQQQQQQQVPAQPQQSMHSMNRVQMRMPQQLFSGLGEIFSNGSFNFKDDDPIQHTQPATTAAAEPEPDESQQGSLSLTANVEYAAIPKGQSQAVFGLLTVKAAETEAAQPTAAPAASASSTAASASSAPAAKAAEAERQSMDLVCVLDVSGSMSSNNRIEELKNAVRFIIDEAGPQDRVSIVTFNTGADRAMRLRCMNSEGKDEATQTLRLNAGGGTSIAAGLDTGLVVVEQRRMRNKVCAILLLTDGQDHSARQALPALIQRANRASCALYAFGFGVDHDADMLREISEQARTPYTFIESVGTIREAFAGVVGGLSSIVAQNVELTINTTMLKQVHTPFEQRRNSGDSLSVLIPDMFAGERRDILLELAAPSQQPADNDGNLKLLEAQIRYFDLQRGGRLVRGDTVTMSIRRVDQVEPDAEPDEEVLAQRQRVEVTAALEEAAGICDRGDFDKARELLRKEQAEVAKKKSHASEALGTELEDACRRMESQQTWARGSAEVQDALCMHKMQRCTNAIASSSTGVQKTSKAMYMQRKQSEWCSKAKGSGD